MLSDTLTGMDEGIELQPCRYGPQVRNNDLRVRGCGIGHMKCIFVSLLGLKR